MTREGDNHRVVRSSLFSRLRKLWSILRTADLVEIFADFDARQRKLEQSQRSIEAMLAETGTRIDALLSHGHNPKTIATSMLDIKNLGYELGRQLAARNLA